MSEEARTARFMRRIEEASAFPMGWKSRDSDGFNRAGEHVVTLLWDAVAAFERGSFGTATFLALTALEETAKAELMLYRRDPGEPKGRDPMRSHANKHAIAVRDTTFMGRLPKLLGAERCEALHTEADAGQLVPLREASLYVDVKDGELVTPKEVIGADRAREILLLAVEAADDALVGYTNHSMEAWSPMLDGMFEELAAATSRRPPAEPVTPPDPPRAR